MNNINKKLAEFQEIIFQLPREQINQLRKEIKEANFTKDSMELPEIKFEESNDLEEDIDNNYTEN